MNYRIFALLAIVIWLCATLYFFDQASFSSAKQDAVSVREVTRENVTKRARYIVAWIGTNQSADGSLPYAYSPQSDAYTAGNNMIRQFLTIQGMFTAGNVLQDPLLEKRAKNALKRIFASRYVEDDAQHVAYITEIGGDIKLGASALAVMASREGKGPKDALDRQEVLLGDFILQMQRDDGSFQTFLGNEHSNLNERFYSGEALTALAILYDASGDKKYTDAIRRSFPYYQSRLKRDFYPQYAPWHMQAYTRAYFDTHDDAYAAYVFWLADTLIDTMLVADVEAHAQEKGRFYNDEKRESWGPPHSSSTGVYTEGLTYAYALAVQRGDAKRSERYRDAILQGLRYLFEVQDTKGDDFRTFGAIQESTEQSDIRIDQLGHALQAFARVLTLKMIW